MNVVEDIEREEKETYDNKIKFYNKSIPEDCVNCPFLERVTASKIRCPYMIKKCIFKI